MEKTSDEARTPAHTCTSDAVAGDGKTSRCIEPSDTAREGHSCAKIGVHVPSRVQLVDCKRQEDLQELTLE